MGPRQFDLDLTTMEILENNKMKKTLSFLTIVFGLSLPSFAAKIAVTVGNGILQPGTTAGFNVSSGTARNFTSFASTVTDSLQSFNTTILGPAPITGATCTATTGGGLTTGSSLYWKIYAIPKVGNGSVGSQTGLAQMTMIPGGAFQTATLSWNQVAGADHYGITRSSAIAPGSPFLLTSTFTGTVFIDTGIAAPSGNPWPSTPYGSTSVYVSGGLLMGGSNMAISWIDYNGSGEIRPYIGPTSAGEWIIKGGLGSNKNNVYFANSSDQNYWRFLQDTSDSSSVIDAVVPGSSNDNHMKVIAGSSITFIVDNFNIADMTSQALNIHNVRAGANQLGLINTSSDAISTIYNGGASGKKEIGFQTSAGTSAYFSDGGNFDFYTAAANVSPTISSSVIQGRSGYVQISTPAYIHGQTVGITPKTGDMGEYSTANAASLINFPATTVWTAITTITITAGDWDVWGHLDVNQNGATCSQYAIALSTFSGSATTDHVANLNQWQDTCRGSLLEWGFTTPQVQFLVTNATATFNVYLKGEVNYSASGPPQRQGSLFKRRRS